MSTETVAIHLGASPETALALEQACIKFGIIKELHKAHFLGQTFVETAGYTKFREDLRYRPERFLEVFKGRNGLRTIEQARAIIAKGRDAIAEAMYGLPWGNLPGKLGNSQPGDGARFTGLGAIHLTGRDNVTRYSRAMYGDDRVVVDPSRLECAPDAYLSAGWFWQVNRINALADTDDVKLVTGKVNGGENGLHERVLATNKAKAEFAALRLRG